MDLVITTSEKSSVRRVDTVFRAKSGFTMVELLVATVLSVIVMAISATSLITIGKASAGVDNYSEMNFQSRLVLEKFGSDVRMGSTVDAFTASRFDFKYIDSTNTEKSVVYEYIPADATLYRTEDATTIAVLQNLTNFSFDYFNLNLNEVPVGNSNLEVKGVRVSARMEQKVVSIGNSNEVLSARFMMRNRLVGN